MIILVYACDRPSADAGGTTVVTSTPTVRQGPTPTAATATTRTPATHRPDPGARGPSGGGRRPRRHNAPSPTWTTRAAAAAEAPAAGYDVTAEFPVTIKSADLFVVTKAKLYSTFTISMKV